MFSSQLGRVARVSSSSSSSSSLTPAVSRTATACLATSATPSLQSKQRRLSSSKASSAPNGSSNGAKPLADTPESDGAAATKKDGGRKASGRRGRDLTAVKPKKSAQPDVDGAFETLPRVAGTGHLHPHDISLSSFFSLHRPLSLTTPLPPTTTQESFASIFDIKSKRAASNPADVIYTLDNTIDQIDPHHQLASGQQSHDAQDLHWQIIQESPSNADGTAKHLDGVPRQPKSLEEMVAQLRPFMTPPPPTAAAAAAAAAQAEQASPSENTDLSSTAAEKLSPAEEISRRSFQTTITVTENTSAEGVKYYTANSTPMVRIPPSSNQHQTPIQDAIRQHQQQQQEPHRQPFLERMRERQMDYEDYRAERLEERSMELISVKRQRKLKMKKHKYKKLMKRTRNLRRRLDRN